MIQDPPAQFFQEKFPMNKTVELIPFFLDISQPTRGYSASPVLCEHSTPKTLLMRSSSSSGATTTHTSIQNSPRNVCTLPFNYPMSDSIDDSKSSALGCAQLDRVKPRPKSDQFVSRVSESLMAAAGLVLNSSSGFRRVSFNKNKVGVMEDTEDAKKDEEEVDEVSSTNVQCATGDSGDTVPLGLLSRSFSNDMYIGSSAEKIYKPSSLTLMLSMYGDGTIPPSKRNHVLSRTNCVAEKIAAINANESAKNDKKLINEAIAKQRILTVKNSPYNTPKKSDLRFFT